MRAARVPILVAEYGIISGISFTSFQNSGADAHEDDVSLVVCQAHDPPKEVEDHLLALCNCPPQ